MAARLAETSYSMIFVRGNHEDHLWLDELEKQSRESIFPVDVYRRVYNLKTGLPWTFQKGEEQIAILGVGRMAYQRMKRISNRQSISRSMKESGSRVADQPIDILLTHDARPDFVLINPGAKMKRSSGTSTIGDLLDSYRPAYHFFGHYGGGPQVRIDATGARNRSSWQTCTGNQGSRFWKVERWAFYAGKIERSIHLRCSMISG